MLNGYGAYASGNSSKVKIKYENSIFGNKATVAYPMECNMYVIRFSYGDYIGRNGLWCLAINQFHL